MPPSRRAASLSRDKLTYPVCFLFAVRSLCIQNLAKLLRAITAAAPILFGQAACTPSPDTGLHTSGSSCRFLQHPVTESPLPPGPVCLTILYITPLWGVWTDSNSQALIKQARHMPLVLPPCLHSALTSCGPSGCAVSFLQDL